jgi:hypothetical protein
MLRARDIRSRFVEESGRHPKYRGEYFIAHFGDVQCRVWRTQFTNEWLWQAVGWIFASEGKVTSKRAAMRAAYACVEEIKAIR